MPDAVTAQAATPATEQDRFMEAMEPLLARYRESKMRREHLALIKVIRLAQDFETAEALCRGERVPRSRLDPEWAKAYGL